MSAMIRRLIRVDGTEQELPAALPLSAIAKMIDATTLDFVSLHHLGRPLHVMAVDDGGYVTVTVPIEGGVRLQPVAALKPVNAKATDLYWKNCKPGTKHQIVGDVVIIPDDDFGGP